MENGGRLCQGLPMLGQRRLPLHPGIESTFSSDSDACVGRRESADCLRLHPGRRRRAGYWRRTDARRGASSAKPKADPRTGAQVSGHGEGCARAYDWRHPMTRRLTLFLALNALGTLLPAFTNQIIEFSISISSVRQTTYSIKFVTRQSINP